jgi:hypothetical protein
MGGRLGGLVGFCMDGMGKVSLEAMVYEIGLRRVLLGGGVGYPTVEKGFGHKSRGRNTLRIRSYYMGQPKGRRGNRDGTVI